jgi:acyl carrier protein
MDASTAVGIPETIEAFIRSEGQLADDEVLDHDEELFAAGYLDSLGVLRLVRFVEATFGVTLTDEDLLSPGFTTVDGLSLIVTAAQAR